MNNQINAFHLINSEIAELPLKDSEKLLLDKLIEQDKCFSEFDFIDGISVWEKGQEKICKDYLGQDSYVRFQFSNEIVPELNGGISFFHDVGGKNWHIRVHKGE